MAAVKATIHKSEEIDATRIIRGKGVGSALNKRGP